MNYIYMKKINQIITSFGLLISSLMDKIVMLVTVNMLQIKQQYNGAQMHKLYKELQVYQ